MKNVKKKLFVLISYGFLGLFFVDLACADRARQNATTRDDRSAYEDRICAGKETEKEHAKRIADFHAARAASNATTKAAIAMARLKTKSVASFVAQARAQGKPLCLPIVIPMIRQAIPETKNLKAQSHDHHVPGVKYRWSKHAFECYLEELYAYGGSSYDDTDHTIPLNLRTYM